MSSPVIDDDQVIINTVCSNPECRRPFDKVIGKKFIRKSGKLAHSVYCPPCDRFRRSKWAGKNIKQIRAQMEKENAFGVRHLSAEEIAELEKVYQPPAKKAKPDPFYDPMQK